jgi:hypothetical protein
MQQAFRGRKKDLTQIVMVAMNYDLKFTYVLAGWEGSAHDATGLADVVDREDGFSVPRGNNTTHLIHIQWLINIHTHSRCLV